MAFATFGFSMGANVTFYVVGLLIICICGLAGTIVAFKANSSDHILSAITIGIVVPIVIYFILGQHSSAENKAFKQSKLDYVQNNCTRIDKPDGSHYYSCTNPDQLILDTSFEK